MPRDPQATPRMSRQNTSRGQKDIFRQLGSSHERETMKALAGANEGRFHHSAGRPLMVRSVPALTQIHRILLCACCGALHNLMQ